MRKILLALLAMAISTPAYTLEVFLNANRSDTGTIGYVDIDRVFNTYSETKASKLDLEKEVRRKEEELERRRTTIYNRKAKATKLRQEKELALILPEMLENQAKKAQAEEKMRADAEKIRREQEELAQKCGVSRQTISAIEKGDYNPTINLCINICRVLGKTLDELFWPETET